MVDFSVILPVRNAAASIRAQLDAIRAQLDTTNGELVVVDDASTDATRRVVTEVTDRDPRVRLVRMADHGGANAARNAGIAAARGSKLLFCDGDDLVAAGWITAMTRALDAFPLVFGALDEHALNPPARRIGPHFAAEPRTTTRALGFLPRGLGCNLGVHRDVAEAVGGFDATYRYGATDTDFCWRVQLAGHPVHHAADAVVQYRHPATLRALARKRFLQGTQHPRLFRAYRGAGMPRRPLRASARQLAAVVLLGPPAIVDARARRRWVEQAARLAGLVVGSIRQRTLYL